MIFSIQKLDLLVDLFRDLAKGLLLGAVGAPILSPTISAIESLRLAMLGLVFVFLAFKAVESREVVER